MSCTETEGIHHIDGEHPIDLYTKTWTPTGETKAKMIIVHGFSDHINRYYELFPTLASRGICVHGYDQRGWGRSVHSPSDKGLSGGTSLVISDLVSVIKSQLPSPVPLFLFGHSMGGAEVLTLACDPEYAWLTEHIRGWMTNAALIGFPPSMQPNSVSVFFGRLAGKLLPKMQRLTVVPGHQVTRDPQVIKDIEDDPLRHDTGTLEQLAGMLDRGDNLKHQKVKLNKGVKALWISHGSGDLTTSWQDSKDFYERAEVQDKTFKSYEGWYHQLHADKADNRDVYARDVGDWILERVEGDRKAGMTSSKL